MSLDHIGLHVQYSKFDAEVAFLTSSFGHLGIEKRVSPFPGLAGLGSEKKAWLWIAGVLDRKPIPDDVAVTRVHLAVTGKDRSDVDKFHVEALKAGGKDNGAPGVRVVYHPNYYGAFVISPGGHNIECVVHDPQSELR